MRYSVNDEIFDDYEYAVNYCIDDDYHEDDDYFEEWVNENEESATINGRTFYAYDILSEMSIDDLAELRDRFCEYMNDDDRENALYELRNASPGDEIYIQNYTVYVLPDEEDENDDDVETKIENIRQFIAEQKILSESDDNRNKEIEDDLMKVFQVIS